MKETKINWNNPNPNSLLPTIGKQSATQRKEILRERGQEVAIIGALAHERMGGGRAAGAIFKDIKMCVFRLPYYSCSMSNASSYNAINILELIF